MQTIQDLVILKMKTLGHIHPYISKKMSLYLYTSLIQPVFEYVDYAYDAMNKCDSNKLQVLQNNCLRIFLLKDTSTSRKDFYEEAKVDTLREAQVKNTCTVVYIK